jgi:hypothetical protein
MPGRTGFGVGGLHDARTATPHQSEQDLLAAAGDTTAILQQIAAYLKKLDDKYANDVNLIPVSVTLTGAAGSTTQRVDMTRVPHDSVIISVIAGTANVFLGDYSGIGQSVVPHLQVPAGTAPQFFFGRAERIYTVVNPSTTTTLQAFVIPIAL